MNIVIQIMQIIALALIFLMIYYAAKKYVFSKLKISKWVVAVFAILSFLIPLIYANVTNGKLAPQWLMLLSQGLMIIFVLWFVELTGFFKKNEERMYKKAVEKDRKKSLEKSRNAYYKSNTVKPKDKPNPRRAKKNTEN